MAKESNPELKPIEVRRTACAVALVGCVAWALGSELLAMVDRWSGDPRYSHGYLVPLFALALLWLRKGQMPSTAPRDHSWIGALLLVLLGACVQAGGGFVGSPWLSGLSLILYLLGVAILWGGWPALVWAGPSIGFLAFMIPLPYRFEVALGPPLQALATKLSTFSLQVLGLMAFSEGNVIRLGEHRIGVVEACSGLSMLMTFMALATGAALVVKRPLIDRLVLVAFAVPIAIIANVLRIVITGVLYNSANNKLAEHFYHDLAGWLMIPLALFMLWLVVAILARMVVDIEEESPLVVGLQESSAPFVVPAMSPEQKRHRR